MTSKTILFIGGPAETVAAARRARFLGYKIIIADGNPDCAGSVWAAECGQTFLLADTYDAGKILAVLSGQKTDGVLAVGCDVGPVVSQAAAALGLPHIPYEVARLGWHKGHLKARLAELGIAVPQLPTAAGQTVVVKPVDGRGARGCRLCRFDSYEQTIAEAEATLNSPTGQFLIEEFIEGDQLSSESVIWDGEALFTGLTDRRYDFSQTWPYPVELGGQGASKYEYSLIAGKIRRITQQLVTSLSIASGTIKCDWVLKNETEPVLIEAAIGRLSGGFMCSHYLPVAYGIDFIGAALAVATGKPPYEYLRFPRTKLFMVGGYDRAATARQHNERGRFRWALGHSAEQARQRLSRKQVNKIVSWSSVGDPLADIEVERQRILSIK